MKYLYTEKSSNLKTGPIATTMSDSATCPPTCPMYAAGCYKHNFPLAIHVKNVDAGAGNATDWEEHLQIIDKSPAEKIRIDVTGDLPGKGDEIDTQALMDLTTVCKSRAFTYTHKPLMPNGITPEWMINQNRKAVHFANCGGLTVNASANTLQEADKMYHSGGIWPIAVILPSDSPAKVIRTPAGTRVVRCPATVRDDVTCATCDICSRRSRSFIVGFPAHGSGKKTVDAIARG